MRKKSKRNMIMDNEAVRREEQRKELEKKRKREMEEEANEHVYKVGGRRSVPPHIRSLIINGTSEPWSDNCRANHDEWKKAFMDPHSDLSVALHELCQVHPTLTEGEVITKMKESYRAYYRGKKQGR